MINRFYERALAAAKISPEAFAAEFEKEDADANATSELISGKPLGVPLIHKLIQDISDEMLPALLEILIKKDTNVKSVLYIEREPLCYAAIYHKKQAVEFLIKAKAELNKVQRPALCAVASTTHGSTKNAIDIIKILIENKADINVQDMYFMSPLCRAAENGQLEIIEYLLSKNADVFLSTGVKTALGCAYNASKVGGKNEQAERCLDILVKEAEKQIFQRACKESQVELFIKDAIKALAGSYSGAYSNSDGLKNHLDTAINTKAIAARIAKERVHTFCMGSKLSKTNLEQKTIPPVYHFFRRDGRKDVTKEIFSFIQPVKKMRTK